MNHALESSFLKAYEQHSDAIFRYCYFRVYDREHALDLVQETFMKTWEYLASGRQIGNLKAFLYKVANNMIIDSARKKKALSLDELRENGFDPALDEREKTERSLDMQILLDNLKDVDEIYREAILLRYVEDLSPEEIAAVTGETPNNISVRIHRGIRQLRLVLQKRTNL